MRINWSNLGLLLVVAVVWGLTSALLLNLPGELSLLIGICIGAVLGVTAPIVKFGQ